MKNKNRMARWTRSATRSAMLLMSVSALALGQSGALATEGDRGELRHASLPPPLASVPTVRMTQATDPIAFKIPVQDLDNALQRYAALGDVQVIYDASITEGLRSRVVSGTFSREEAIRKMLEGTGLRPRFNDSRSVTILAQASSGTATDANLPTVNVQADDAPTQDGARQESAYGPVDGYVATRSATATKTDTAIIETPRSISVITSTEMEERGVETIGDALSYTAGIVVDSFGDEVRYDTIYIRGFDVSDNGIYIDGLRISFPPASLTKLDPYGFERVEVLKGPASVLYGQINPGGMINAITKRPPTEPLFSGEVLYGTYDRKRAAIDVGGAFAADSAWSGRLTALVQDSDAQHDFGKSDRVYVAPAIAWRPTDQTEWILLSNYQYDETGPYPGFLPASGTIDPNPNGRIPANRTGGAPTDIDDKERYAVTSLLDHQFNQHFGFRQVLRYSNVNYYSEGIFPASLQADGRTVNRFNYLADDTVSTFAVDNQTQVKFHTGSIEHKILAGLDYRHVGRTFEQGFQRAEPLDIFTPVYDYFFVRPSTTTEKSEQTQLGLYVQDQAEVGDRLFVSVGGRWDRAENDPDTSTAGSETEDRAFTWSGGVLYKTNIGLSPYVSHARSFLPQIGTDVITNEPFVPTEGQQTEAGVKWASPDERSLVTLSVFDLTQVNSLTSVPGTFGSTQTGEIRSRGMELEGRLQIGDHWILHGAYAYIDAEYTRDNELQGLEAEQSPRHLASLWGRYEDLLPGLSLGVGVRYVGRRVYGYEGRGTSAVTELYHPSKTLFDATVDYKIGKVTASLDARNLFNNESFSCYSEGYGFCVPDNAREISFRLRYDW